MFKPLRYNVFAVDLKKGKRTLNRINKPIDLEVANQAEEKEVDALHPSAFDSHGYWKGRNYVRRGSGGQAGTDLKKVQKNRINH